jgi:hypothetical protein
MRRAHSHAVRLAVKVQRAEPAGRLATSDVAAELSLAEEAQGLAGFGATLVAADGVVDEDLGVNNRLEVIMVCDLLDTLVETPRV